MKNSVVQAQAFDSFILRENWFKSYEKEGDTRPLVKRSTGNLETMLSDPEVVKYLEARNTIKIERMFGIRVSFTNDQLQDLGLDFDRGDYHAFKIMTKHCVKSEVQHLRKGEGIEQFHQLKKLDLKKPCNWRVLYYEFFLEVGNMGGELLPYHLQIVYNEIKCAQNWKEFIEQEAIERFWKACFRMRKASFLFQPSIRPALKLKIQHPIMGEVDIEDHMWEIPGHEKWEQDIMLEDQPKKFTAVELDRIPTKEQAFKYFKSSEDIFGERFFPVIVCPIPDPKTEEWEKMIRDIRDIPKSSSTAVEGTFEDKPALFIGTRCKSYEFPDLIETAYDGGAFAITREWDW